MDRTVTFWFGDSIEFHLDMKFAVDWAVNINNQTINLHLITAVICAHSCCYGRISFIYFYLFFFFFFFWGGGGKLLCISSCWLTDFISSGHTNDCLTRHN